ncbi:MAG TPA: SpoIIE family protein phosphatase, partial [Kineosporiaceae bacterium]
LDPAGRAYQLTTPADLPLGVDADTRYTEHTHVLPPSARLVLFTDGLTDGERAVHPCTDAFLELLTQHVDDEPQALADALVARPTSAPPLADDAALLVVELLPLDGRDPGRSASRSFPSTPAATPTARRFLLDVLDAWRVDDLKDVAALAVSELVTNAVLHTAGEVRLNLRWFGKDQLWVGVTDESDRMPAVHQAADDDISGRGLAIVDQVAAAWGVDYHPAGGKTVWLTLRQDLAEAASRPTRSGPS